MYKRFRMGQQCAIGGGKSCTQNCVNKESVGRSGEVIIHLHVTLFRPDLEYPVQL